MISFKEYFLCEKSDSNLINGGNQFVSSFFSVLTEKINNKEKFPIKYYVENERSYRYFYIVVDSVKIRFLQEHKNYSGSFNYKNSEITIYDNTIYSDIIHYNSSIDFDDDDKQYKSNKTSLLSLRHNSEFKSTLFHEYIHYYDATEYVIGSDKFSDNLIAKWKNIVNNIYKNKNLSQEKINVMVDDAWKTYYYNNSHEVNAYFLSAIKDINKNVNYSFETFYKIFQEKSKHFLKYLSPENKKKIIKRAYLYYSKFRLEK
jgi:hypothetical protein